MHCKQADQTGFAVWLLCTVHFTASKHKYKTDLTCLLIVACGELIQWHFWSQFLKVLKILRSFHCAYSKNPVLISVKGDFFQTRIMWKCAADASRCGSQRNEKQMNSLRIQAWEKGNKEKRKGSLKMCSWLTRLWANNQQMARWAKANGVAGWWEF